MPLTSYQLAPTNESTISLQDMQPVLGQRFTAVTSGKREPYAVTCKLVRGGSTLTPISYSYPDTETKEVDPHAWDIAGDLNHVIHTHANGALEFSGGTGGTEAIYERQMDIVAGSRVYFTFDVDETIVGSDVIIQVNLYNDIDVEIGSSTFKRSAGDGTGAFKLSFLVEEPLTRLKIKFENVTWGASSGNVYAENFALKYDVPDTLAGGYFQIYLYDIAEDEVIATSVNRVDLSTLNLGVNELIILMDDPRFRIESGKEYYVLFTKAEMDYTGWDTLPTDGEKAIPTGNIQTNVWIDIEDHTGVSTESDPDFSANPTNSPTRITKTISTLSGLDTTVLGLNGYYGLSRSENYTLFLRVLPSALSGFPGGGGANVLDLTVRVVDQTSTLVTSTVQIALEDAGTYQDFELDFSTSSAESDVQIEVVWDSTPVNPNTPTITMKITGVFVWVDDGVVTTPAKYQLPSYMVGYAGVYLVTEDTPSATMEKRTAGAWVVDAALPGVTVLVQAGDTPTNQYLLNSVGDALYALDDIWPSSKLEQPAAMQSALNIIEAALDSMDNLLPLPVQLRVDDIPYQSDWVSELITNYGLNTLQSNGMYLWTTLDNQYAGRFIVHNGEVIPLSSPFGTGRVELREIDLGGGTIGSGTTTKYTLATTTFNLLQPAKVKVIWGVSAYDYTIVANADVNIRLEVDGVPIPDGAGSDDTTDKFIMNGTVTTASNMIYFEWTIDSELAAGSHTITIKGTRGVSPVTPSMTFKERTYTLPVLLNNYVIKPTSLLEVVYT